MSQKVDIFKNLSNLLSDGNLYFSKEYLLKTLNLKNKDIRIYKLKKIFKNGINNN